MAAFAIAVSITTTAAFAQTPGAAATQTPALKIVVLTGEDAVNIIQQKTAVAPLVEVRDRNNLPVPGAVVTFTVGGGQGATFGGATTLTVTTNAAGQAAAAGFTPTAAGAIQVNATAVFQGQTAIATITQTNVMTAAEAAGAAGGSAGGGASGGGTSGATTGGAVGGSAGGLGMGAIAGIVGGAVAGGAVVAKGVSGGDSTPTSTTSTPTSSTPTTSTAPPPTTPAPTTPTPTTPAPTPASSNVSGPFNGPYVSTVVVDGGLTCTANLTWIGTLRLNVTNTNSVISGTVDGTGTQAFVSNSCNLPIPGIDLSSSPIAFTGPLSGSPSSITFRQDLSQSIAVPGYPNVSVVGAITFTGSLSNGVVTGTLAVNSTVNFPGDPATGGSFKGTASGTFPITAR